MRLPNPEMEGIPGSNLGVKLSYKGLLDYNIENNFYIRNHNFQVSLWGRGSMARFLFSSFLYNLKDFQ